MFFSKVLLVAVVLAPISALATPHAHNHAIHRRAVVARLAEAREAHNNHTTARQNSPKCAQRPPASSQILIPSQVPKTTAQQPAPVVNSPPPPPPPSPTPSPTPSPAPSPAPSPSPTTTQQQQPTTVSGPTQGGSGPFTGEGTFFATGLGACGITNVDTDFICAISEKRFDTFPGYNGVNPNTNPVCGKKVQINYQGKSVTVTIVDRCTGCAFDDLDLTTTAFQQIADLGIGRLQGISWNFI